MSASKENKDKVAGLFEFVDERKIGVAYLSQINDAFWQKSDKNINGLTEIIKSKTVLRVSWPSDKDESPKTVPAILLKTGKWEIMCELRDNVDKYNTFEPTKEDRRAFSDVRNRKSEENTTQTTKKGKKNSKKDQRKKEASIRVSQERLMSRINREGNKRKRIENDSDNESDPSSADDSIKHGNTNKRKKKNSTEDSELYKSLSKLIREEFSSIKKSVEKSMNIIASKVTTVEKDIALLRSQLTAVSLSLGSSLEILPSGGYSHQSSEMGDLPTARKSFDSPPHQGENTCKSSLLHPNSLLDMMKMELVDTSDTSTDFLPDIPPAASQTIDTFFESRPPVQVTRSVSKSIAMDRDEDPDSNASARLDEHGRHMIKTDIETTSFDSITRDEEPVQYSLPAEYDSNERLFENFGGVLIDQNKLRLCGRNGKLSKFVHDVMLLIFSRQEMADSSISGKRANVHAKRGVDEVREKKQLDIVKVKALIEYIKREIPGSEEKKIVEAIRSKLKYEGTRMYGVGFRKPDDKNTETTVVDTYNY